MPKKKQKNTEDLEYIEEQPEKEIIVKRTKTHILIEISLSPEQIKEMELALEDICNKFLKM